METQNPVLRKQRVSHLLRNVTDVCTLDGTVQKSLALLFITIAVTALFWNTSGTILAPYLYPILIGSAILGLIVALVLAFNPQWAPGLAPAYAAIEGVFLGTISMIMEAVFPGIVLQAVLLTFGVAALMLTLYKTRVIRVTQKFRTVVILATLSILLVYAVGWILAIFGVSIPYIHESGPIGIIFSLVVVTIAALNLLLDFDAIEHAVKERSPKFMEWFLGFALLVTIVWLYVEILQLLAKIRGSD